MTSATLARLPVASGLRSDLSKSKSTSADSSIRISSGVTFAPRSFRTPLTPRLTPTMSRTVASMPRILALASAARSAGDGSCPVTLPPTPNTAAITSTPLSRFTMTSDMTLLVGDRHVIEWRRPRRVQRERFLRCGRRRKLRIPLVAGAWSNLGLQPGIPRVKLRREVRLLRVGQDKIFLVRRRDIELGEIALVLEDGHGGFLRTAVVQPELDCQHAVFAATFRQLGADPRIVGVLPLDYGCRAGTRLRPEEGWHRRRGHRRQSTDGQGEGK